MHMSACQSSASTSECKRRRLDRDTLNSSGNSDAGSSSSGEMDTVDSPKGKKPVQFSQQLIAFTLYGTQKHIGSSNWPAGNILMLSSRVGEVTKHFPDIPSMFNFGLSTVQFGAVGVFCNRVLQKGTILGPFTGKKLSIEEAHRKYKGTYWEIHSDSGVKYCLDGSDPCYRNWMYFIQYARSRSEQNLTAVQYNENLYFKAAREVQPGEELLVWYDQTQYNLYMGIPQGFTNLTPEDKLESRHVVEREEDVSSNTTDEELTDNEEIEIIEDSQCCNDINKVTVNSLNSSENESENESSNKSLRQSPTLYSPVYPQFLSHSIGRGIPGFTSAYPLPTVQLPWAKHHLHPTVNSTGLPIAWPILAPPTSPLSSSGHAHKPSSLDMFVRGVEGNRWQCQICQKVFTSQGSLRAHARIHTGERPYQCRFCKRTFTQASTLRSHERLHTGERPYKCKNCGKAFTQSAGLRSHLKTHVTR